MKTCNLHVKDFCNVKFEGLDPILRKRLVSFLKYLDPNARYSHAFKLKRWDGKISFFSAGGATYFNMLPLIIPMIMDEGYEIHVEDDRPEFDWVFPEIDDEYLSDICWPEGHPMAGEPIMLREHQVRAINGFTSEWQACNKIATSAGKAQPLRSKVKVPGGWSTIGDINIGDVVSTPDGNSAKVTGVFPQGIKPIYRVTFKDGRTAEACGDHLWNVQCLDFKKLSEKGKHVRTLTTDQIAHRLANTKRPMKVALPVHETQEDVDLPIDPYVMGVLIGDGGLKHRVVISSADQEIIDNVSSRLIDGYEMRYQTKYDYSVVMTPEHNTSERHRVRWNDSSKNRKILTGSANYYRNVIESLGLSVESNAKFIPQMYLHSSLNQKLELLQGLIDTDGYVGKHGEISYTSVSKKLAEDVAYLIRSIGGTARITSRITNFTYKGEYKQGQKSYTVCIRYRDPKSLVSLSRKKNRISDNYNTIALQICSVEYIGDHEAKCIMVDHTDHLYITDNFVVTHNTVITAALSKLVEEVTGGRSIVIVPSKSLVVQTATDYKNIGLDVGVYFGNSKELGHKHTVVTWQSLAVLNKKGKKRTKTKAGKWETKSTFDETFDIEAFLKDVTCVIIDEAHGGASTELRELLCGPMAHIPLRWGMTGTIPKQDHSFAAVLAGIGPVCLEITSNELIEKGVISKCNIDVVQLKLKQTVGNFFDWDSEKKYFCTDQKIMEWLAKFTEEITENGSTLLLVENIDTGKILEKLIPGSVFVYGNVSVDDRKVEYKKIDSTKNNILIATYGVAAVGISMTFLYNIILFNSGKSPIRVLQSIGRILRKGKSELVDMEKHTGAVFDICSDLKFSTRHLALRKSYYKEEKFPFTVTKVEI